MTTVHTSNVSLADLGPNTPSAAKRALSLLQALSVGGLRLQLPDSHELFFGHSEGPQARLVLHNWKVFAASLRSGDIGFA